MGIPLYQAMTSSEFQAASKLPTHTAWMACHFSPYTTGISNLPRHLPAGSLLILNDRTPIHSHDPKMIIEQLIDIIQQFSCSGVLLDFQEKDNPELLQLTSYLSDALPCPVASPVSYAGEKIPVFVPPIPLDCPIRDYLSAWDGKEIWLEAALDGCAITLSEMGAKYHPFSPAALPEPVQADDKLHCHYYIEESEKEVTFFLYRTQNDLRDLLDEAEQLGVTCAVGLYQELGIR